MMKVVMRKEKPRCVCNYYLWIRCYESHTARTSKSGIVWSFSPESRALRIPLLSNIGLEFFVPTKIEVTGCH